MPSHIGHLPVSLHCVGMMIIKPVIRQAISECYLHAFSGATEVLRSVLSSENIL